MDYTEFLGDVLLFRAVRDMEDTPCSQGPPKELWLDIRLESIGDNPDWTPEQQRYLILASKVADLLDDRKGWLLASIEADLNESANLNYV